MQPAALFANMVLGAFVIYLLVLGAASMLALFKGASELRRLAHAAPDDSAAALLKSPLVPGVSVLMVARDATAEARDLARRLLDLHSGRHELVLVLDGPSDAALAQWTDELRLIEQERTISADLPAKPVRTVYVSREPLKVAVVVKDAGGEADALNAGVNAAQYPLIGLVDPRAGFIPEWLLRLLRPMLQEWDGTAAVLAAGLPAPVPGFAGRLGALEALRRWMVRGAAFARWRKIVPIPGACAIVKRQAVVEAGGFRYGVVGMFQKMNAAGLRVVFLPSRVSWSQAPASFAEIRADLRRDQRQVASGVRHLAFRQSAGLFRARLLRPLVETAALAMALAGLALGWVDGWLFGLVILASAGVGLVLSLAAVILREAADPGSGEPAELLRLFLTAVPENLGYRQVRNLWLIAAFFGARRFSEKD